MQIATDANGNVVLEGNGLPAEWNGLSLTVHTLTQEQEAAYNALRADRASTIFDGTTFTAVGSNA